MNNKIITIVTVCYNAENTIRETMMSVVNQDYRPLEYIIVDGASKDKTLEVIESYKEDILSNGIDFKLISERDNGIYDAMNKGAASASGEWINFLNSGDVFYDNIVISNIFQKNDLSGIDFLYGDIEYTLYNTTSIKKSKEPSVENLKTICHQASFVRADVQNQYKFNLKYKIVSDYNCQMEMFFSGKKFVHLPIVMVSYNMDGISSTNQIKTYKERYSAERENGIGDSRIKMRKTLCIMRFKTLFKKILPKPLVYKIMKKRANNRLDKNVGKE